MDDYDSEGHHHHHHSRSGSGYAEVGESRHHHHHHSSSGSETAASSADDSGEGGRHHHHHHSAHPSQRASQASALCVIAAFLSFLILIIAHLIAKNLSAPPNPMFNMAAAGIAAMAFVFGFYAKIVQIRYWNPKVRTRLLVGMPVAILVIVMTGVNFYRQYQPMPQATLRPAGEDQAEAATNDNPTAEGQAPQTPEDTSLFKPGWSGEGELEGVIATVNSYNENATESRQFNRRLIRKKVSYAVLSIMNKSEKPITLTSFQVVATEREGMTWKSLSSKALLNENAAANGDKLALLVTPRTLAPGAMLANIPICMPEDFTWDAVISVAFPFGQKDLTIQGQMLTAEQREALLAPKVEDSAATNAPAKPADKYFENL